MISADTIELELLRQGDAARYAELTFPSYRALLSPGNEAIAVGASNAGEPAGLALGRKDGAILSLAVKAAFRRQGIGSLLLARMEQEIAAAGAESLTCTYMTGNPSTDAIERMLQRQGWETPIDRMLVCHCSVEATRKASWMIAQPTPDGVTIVRWIDLPRDERRAFDPDSGEDFESANSLALRVNGRLAGCVVTHRIARGLLRYTKLVVGAEEQGLGLVLLAEAIRRHPIEVENEFGIFDIRMDNRLMLNLVRRRLQPYLTHAAKTKGSRKILK